MYGWGHQTLENATNVHPGSRHFDRDTQSSRWEIRIVWKYRQGPTVQIRQKLLQPLSFLIPKSLSRPSKCHCHHQQRWCKFGLVQFYCSEHTVFCCRLTFCHNFAYFLSKSSRKSRAIYFKLTHGSDKWLLYTCSLILKSVLWKYTLENIAICHN